MARPGSRSDGCARLIPDVAVTELPEELGFRFQHGPLARSLSEFASAIAQAPTSVVYYHREHYVPWMRDVLHETKLARRLEGYAAAPPAPDVYREILVDLLRARLADTPR